VERYCFIEIGKSIQPGMNPPSTPPSPPTPPQIAAATQQSGLALASMILGICGIVLCLGPLAGIPAVICGHMAQSKIKQSGGGLTGSGLATAGLVTGYLSILWIFVIGMMAAIAIPNFVKARNQAQSAACRNNLQLIQGAKETWALETKQTPSALPTDEDLFGESKLMGKKPTCPAGGIYLLNTVQESPSCSEHGTIR
jgi:general secretion pathway protein G